MPQITDIRPQKKSSEKNPRLNIYIDGKFSFGIDLENFVRFGLKINKELSEEEIEKIIKKSLLQKYLNNLLKFASLRPRSEKEVNTWFKRKQVPESLIKDLFNKVKNFELIDDNKFAKWWVEQRNTFRPRAKNILIAELRLKGINKEIIKEVLSEYKIDEISIAKKELEKRFYKFEKLPSFDRKRKMTEFLARKGYSWETVKKVVNALTENE